MPRTQSTQGACPGPVLPGVQSCAFPLEPILAHRADPLETLASVSPPVKEESVPGDPWGLSLLGKGSSRLPSARFQTSGSKDSEVCVCRRGGVAVVDGGAPFLPTAPGSDGGVPGAPGPFYSYFISPRSPIPLKHLRVLMPFPRQESICWSCHSPLSRADGATRPSII